MDKENSRVLDDQEGEWLWRQEQMLESINGIRRQVAIDLVISMENMLQTQESARNELADWEQVKDQMDIIASYQQVRIDLPQMKVLKSPIGREGHLAGLALRGRYQSQPWSFEKLAKTESRLQKINGLPWIHLWWHAIKARDRLGDTPIEGVMVGWIGYRWNAQRKNDRFVRPGGDTYIAWDTITQIAKRAVAGFATYPPWARAAIREIWPPDLGRGE